MDDSPPKCRYRSLEQIIHIAHNKPRPSCAFLCGNVFSSDYLCCGEKIFVARFGAISWPCLVTGRLHHSIFPVANAFLHGSYCTSVPWILVWYQSTTQRRPPHRSCAFRTAAPLKTRRGRLPLTPSLAAPFEQARPCRPNHE